MKKFIITESEKNRILSLHGTKLLNEQYDDNWFTGLESMVASVNSKLPKGCPKLLALKPGPTGYANQTSAAVSVNFDGKTKPTLFQFYIFRTIKDNVVYRVSSYVTNIVPESQMAVVTKEADQTTKKIVRQDKSNLNTGTLFTIGNELRKKDSEALKILGKVLMGQKSKDDKGQIVNDYSAIPAEIITAFNNATKALDTFVQAKA
jgi:hypothetical protein